MRRARLVALACAAACTHQPLYVSPASIEGAREHVVAHERVQVPSSDGTIEMEPDHVVELVTNDGRHLRMRLDELVRDCPPHEPEVGRLCNQRDVSLVIGDSKLELNENVNAVLRGTLVVSLVVGLPVCAFECRSPYNYISDGVMIVTGVALIAFVSVLAHNLRKPMT